MVASGDAVQRAGNAAELGGHDNERFVEQRLTLVARGRRSGKIAQQVRHRPVELIAANVVVRFRLVIEDVPVVIPVGMRDVDVARSGVRHHQVARQQAAQTDLVFAVAGALFLGHLEGLRPARVAEDLDRRSPENRGSW